MKEFIGNPIQEEYYDEDDVEIEVYYEGMGMDNFVYIDPNEMGIEIDDDDDEVEDEDFENFSLGVMADTSEDEEEYADDDESLSDGVQEAQQGQKNKGSLDSTETDSDYTQSSDDGCPIKGDTGDSSNSN